MFAVAATSKCSPVPSTAAVRSDPQRVFEFGLVEAVEGSEVEASIEQRSGVSRSSRSMANEVEIDAHMAAIDAGELDLILAPRISAWGRRRDSLLQTITSAPA